MDPPKTLPRLARVRAQTGSPSDEEKLFEPTDSQNEQQRTAAEQSNSPAQLEDDHVAPQEIFGRAVEGSFDSTFYAGSTAAGTSFLSVNEAEASEEAVQGSEPVFAKITTALDDAAENMANDGVEEGDDAGEDDPFEIQIAQAMDISDEELAQHTATYGEMVEAAEAAQAEIDDGEIEAQGIAIDMAFRGSVWDQLGYSTGSTDNDRLTEHYSDFFRRLSHAPELVFELAKHLHIKAFMVLYRTSRDFYEVINGHMTHSMLTIADHQACDSATVFVPRFYRSLCMIDPVRRTHAHAPRQDATVACTDSQQRGSVRMVPSPKWLQMVVHRERTVRNILACLARQGHRMPTDTPLALKKMWLIMDISTTARRAQAIRNLEYFTNRDLWLWQMFIVKLDMRFNDPIEGPGDDGLRKLMLGQRGLSPLCRMLQRKRFRYFDEVAAAAIRYCYAPRRQHRFVPILDIEPQDIGKGHLEGWGKGRVHLDRPDELVLREASRRRLHFENHVLEMMIWGWINPVTGEDIRTTRQEVYMSDSEDCPLDDAEELRLQKKERAEAASLNSSELSDYEYCRRECMEDADGDVVMTDADPGSGGNATGLGIYV